MVEAVARKVVVEIEVPEGVELGDLLKGVKYRVLGDRGERIREVRRRYIKTLGGYSSLEEYKKLEEETWER